MQKNFLSMPLIILHRYYKALNFLRNGLEIGLTAFVFILIPFVAFTLITSKTGAFFGFQSFTVLSGSMSPVIPTGSIVYTKKAAEIKPGDIITFKRKNVNVTHRVMEITDKDGKPISGLVSPLPGAPGPGEIYYKTKGDANNAPDTDLVPKSDIIGKTFVNIPGVGRFANFLKTLPGFLVFVIGPTLTFVYFELWNIKKEVEKQTEKRVMERLRMT